MSRVGVAKAKAQFLSLVDEVATKRQTITLTHRGKALAQLIPVPESAQDDPLAMYRIAGVKILGDLSEPVSDPEEWEYD